MKNKYFKIFIFSPRKQIYPFTCKLVLLLTAYCLLLNAQLYAQKLAILAPEKTNQSNQIQEKLADSLSDKINVLDFSLSETVLLSKDFDSPFNLSLKEAENLGTAIGCDFFVLIKTDNLQRFSLEEKSYFESFAAFYLVSSRTGRLVFWRLKTFKGADEKASKTKLINSIDEVSAEILIAIKTALKNELAEKDSKIEELPRENSSEAKDFRPPLPYKRIKPEYTNMAYLYGISATIDVIVDIDTDGKILKTEVARWAGFGLDESAVKTINQMNWRPATRDGEFLPMRILLRYNFKDIDE